MSRGGAVHPLGAGIDQPFKGNDVARSTQPALPTITALPLSSTFFSRSRTNA